MKIMRYFLNFAVQQSSVAPVSPVTPIHDDNCLQLTLFRTPT